MSETCVMDMEEIGRSHETMTIMQTKDNISLVPSM